MPCVNYSASARQSGLHRYAIDMPVASHHCAREKPNQFLTANDDGTQVNNKKETANAVKVATRTVSGRVIMFSAERHRECVEADKPPSLGESFSTTTIQIFGVLDDSAISGEEILGVGNKGMVSFFLCLSLRHSLIYA